MTPLRQEPFAQFNFLVDVGTGSTQAGFQDVTGLDRDATSRVVTLKRGVMSALVFDAWMRALRSGAYAGPVTIRLQSEGSATPTIWKVIGARIIKHTSAPLNAKGADVAMEELVLSYERLESA
jgi:phage tail-like protein